MKKFSALLCFVLCLALCASAQINIGAPPSPVASSITVSTNKPTISVSGSTAFQATLVMSDSSLNIDITAQCAWASSDTTKLTMLLNVATGVATGSPVVSCSVGGLIGNFTETVGVAPGITIPACSTPPCALAQGVNGAAYSLSPLFAAVGGSPPYTWSVSVGSLPGWASLSNTGCGTNFACNITGTAATGSTNFSIKVCDTLSNCSANLALNLTVVGSVACGAPTYACGSSTKCSVSNVPTWLATDGPAATPINCYNTLLAQTPAGGSTVTVNTAAQFTSALASAACGQKITLTAGNVFSGHFVLPPTVCPLGNYLWIQSSAMASLPAEGTRTSPCYSGVTSQPGRPAYACPGTPGTYTAQVITPDSRTALQLTAGTSGVRIMGLEITRASGTKRVAELVGVGGLGTVDHVVLDRVWCHGNESIDETTRCGSSGAASYIAVVDSYLGNFFCVSATGVCTDSQAWNAGINNTNSTQETVLKLVNNYMEAAAENFLSGGGGSLTTPADLEIRLNTMNKPQIWNPGDPTYNGGIAGHAFIVKNCFEMKNAQRVLFEGNTCSGLWGGFSQVGYALVVTPANQSGNCPVCFVADLTERYSTISGAGGFINAVQPTTPVAASAARWSFHDLVADDLYDLNCYKCASSSTTIAIRESPNVTFAQHLDKVTVNHVTAVYSSNAPAAINGLLGFNGALISTGNAVSNVIFTNNAAAQWKNGTFNVEGADPTNCADGKTAGTPMITSCWTPMPPAAPNSFGGNCIINNSGGAGAPWPGTNVTSLTTFTSAFTSYSNGNGGNYVIAAGACKNAGLDGLDPGANIAQVASILAGN
jgi:hypothetical protein